MGVEPTASLVLSEGGLPVPYRAMCFARCHRTPECPAGVEPACPVWMTVAWAARPRTLLGQRKERELNPQGSSLVRVQAGCRRQSACPSVSVWMAGFEPAWSGFRNRRMMPGSPTSRSKIIAPTKKARSRVTPGLGGNRLGTGCQSRSGYADGVEAGWPSRAVSVFHWQRIFAWLAVIMISCTSGSGRVCSSRRGGHWVDGGERRKVHRSSDFPAGPSLRSSRRARYRSAGMHPYHPYP